MAEERGRAVLDWTVANWITVTLMAAVSFFIAATAMKLYQRKAGAKA